MVLVNSFLIVILVICVVTDLRERKIYNKIIFPSLLVAFIANFAIAGWAGIMSALLGFIVGLLVLFIPYYFGGIGAGDVKLLALIGALKGASFVFYTAIYMALIGAVIALAIIFFKRGWAKKMVYYLYGRRHGMPMEFMKDKSALTATYPYGVAIALGASIVLTFGELGVL